jgi:DHA1 family multidrug resistance protein-like MFS transporter
MLFAARILAGILSSATAPTTMAYIGDCAPDGEVGKAIGRLTAAGGIGGILGPMLGGLVASDSLSTPFFIAAVFAGISLILTMIFLPESKPEMINQISKEQPLVNIREWIEAIFSPFGKLFILTFISTSSLYIFSSTFGLYGLNRFGFGTEEIGIIYMTLALVSMLAVGLLIGPATKAIGEKKVVIYGFFIGASGLGSMILSNGLVSVILSTSILATAISLQSTALISLTSKRTTSEQGVTMGLNNSFVSLGRIAGPILGGLLLDKNIYLPFTVGAGLLLTAAILSLNWTREVN